VGTSGQHAPINHPVPPRPKPAQSGTSHWLDNLSDVKVGQPESPPPRPKIPSPAPRENRGGMGAYRNPGGNHHDSGSSTQYRPGYGSPQGRPHTPSDGPHGRGPRPDRSYGSEQRTERRPGFNRPRGNKFSKPVPQPKPKAPKTPPPQPFEPTPEQIAQIELRYRELAVPTEFDGIRTQIAKETGVPKKAVKKIVKELRQRSNLPSWWETQTYKGTPEELAKIRSLYEPMLPVPPVGVHKIIAQQVEIKPGVVYQAIKTIRLEMNLPQYNDPSLHEDELEQLRQEQSEGEATASDVPAQDNQSGPVDAVRETSD
ncbi:MAG TPA: hypothetical protein VH593_07385, partial [Ktedonobacteraceae bacterium]